MVNNREQEQASFNLLYKECLRDGALMFAGRLLWRATRLRGETVALIYQNTTITYNQLYARVCALSKKLRTTYNLKPRDKGIICFDNSPEFYVAYFALWQAGVVVVPVNTFLKEKELAHIITDSQPAIIMTSSDRIALFEQTGVALPPIATERDMSDDLSADLSEEALPVLDPFALSLSKGSEGGAESEALAKEDDIVDLGPDELAALLYTSGTTGVPKGVMLSSRNIMTNVLQIAALLGVAHHERILGVLPLFHSFAQNTCVWASLFYGVTIVLVPKIDRHAIVEGLAHKPTIFLGVPALYGLLCLMKTAPLDSVRLFVCGGDALPDKIRAGFGLLYRRKIANGYGLTETSPVVAVNVEDATSPTSCIGRPLVNVTCAIRDEQGNNLPDGSIGVVWVKGDNVMLGYYNASDATEQVLKDGWFNTGDLAYINEKGALVITGRQKDLIIHKGFNIYPQEIENVLLSHPNVIRAGVVGKHDGDGEIPVAFVQLRVAQNNIERELRSLCMQHLAIYKVPKQFIGDTKDLPATATGKVDKKVLRALLAAEEI